MIIVDVVSKIDLSIVVGVIVVHEFFSEVGDVGTVPSSITNWGSEWTVAIDVSEFGWTVGISPFVFTDNDTVVDFTSIDGSVVVGITVLNKGGIMFWVDIIFWVDGTINIGIIVSNDFVRVV